MKKKIRDFIFQELIYSPNHERFGDDDDLIEAGLDSMGIMRLILFIESAFDVSLPDEEIEPDNIQSFNAIEQWVLRHKKET